MVIPNASSLIDDALRAKLTTKKQRFDALQIELAQGSSNSSLYKEAGQLQELIEKFNELNQLLEV
jgi:hypothetical protein